MKNIHRHGLRLALTAIAVTSLLFPFSRAIAQAIATDDPLDNTPLMPDFTGCGGSSVSAINAAYEQQVVELTNQQRADYGLPPLKRTAELDAAARYHAVDMYQDNYIEHDTYDRVSGKLVWICSWDTRLGLYYSGSSWIAENAAMGYTTPQSVVTGWMGSEGHKANILNPNLHEIGVGFDQNYWVQDFGTRPGVYPVVIDGDASITETRQVSLYIYGKGTFTQMRVRNDSDAWGNWQPFQDTLSWMLDAGLGQHTVSVEMTNSSQDVTTSDQITLFSLADLKQKIFLPSIDR
jgi:uncharacterized protein YkwD